MILRCAALAMMTSLPAAAQDMVETCRITQSCQFGTPCNKASAAIGIDTYFGEGDAATYVFDWNGQDVDDVRNHDGHVFTWLSGAGENQRSFALSYIYNSQMPDPEVAEFLLMETVVQGRLTDTIIHSGLCRESE